MGIPNETKFGLVSEVSSKVSHREQLFFFFSVIKFIMWYTWYNLKIKFLLNFVFWIVETDVSYGTVFTKLECHLLSV